MSLTTTYVNVVCPVCSQQHLFMLLPGYSNLNCPQKNKAFDVLFAKTRAKNQHASSRKSGVKIYQIRLILPNRTEQLVEFQSRVPRFELRAGDSAIVAYIKGRPKLFRTVRYINIWYLQMGVL